MSDDTGDQQERQRQIVAAVIVLLAAALATVGTLLWSFWALVITPVVAMVAAVRLGGRGELRVVREADGLRMTVPDTEGTTRKIVAASLAFSVAFAIPSLITTAVAGLIPSSPIIGFVGVFTVIGIALAVRALVPMVVHLGEKDVVLRLGRTERRIRFEAMTSVNRDGGKVTIDAGDDSASIACAGPTMAQAVATRLRDALGASREVMPNGPAVSIDERSFRASSSRP